MVIMDTRHRKMDQKTSDRGDLKRSLLQKLFHDLDIADFMPNRDRGDSKTNTVRQTRILINNNEKPQNGTQKNKTDKNRSIEITVSEVKPKKIDELIIKHDNETEYVKEKVVEEAKAQTVTKTSSNKLKTTINRHLATSEKVTRHKAETNRIEDKPKGMYDKTRNIDDKVRRTDQRNKKTDDNNTSKVDNKRNKVPERHELFRRVEIVPRIDHLTKDENCGTEDYLRDEKHKISDGNTRIDEKGGAIDKVKNPRLPPKESKISDKNLSFKGPVQTYEARKLLRQKYTVKLKNSNKNVGSKDDIGKGNGRNDHSELNLPPLEEPKDHLKEPDIYQLIKTKKARDEGQRKPIIKTIRLRHDNRVYKAVTFVEDKTPAPPLQIKMPIQKKTEETNTMKNKFVKVTLSKVSMNDKRKKVMEIRERERKFKEKKPRREKVRNRPLSPIFPTLQGCSQTEVAKWAPSSINQLTKPYYEAWVDTTLTAITKCSEEEKELMNKQNIIRTFKRAIDLGVRPNSPDLVYEKMHDEKFMGRITVRQKR